MFIQKTVKVLNGTARAVCKPGILQQQLCSGHSNEHVIKVQSPLTLDAF